MLQKGTFLKLLYSCMYCCLWALNMFKSIEMVNDNELQHVIYLLNFRKATFIVSFVKCIVNIWWLIAWLGDGSWCFMKGEKTCTMNLEWITTIGKGDLMILYLGSMKRTNVSQFLLPPQSFLKFHRPCSLIVWVIRKRVHFGHLRYS